MATDQTSGLARHLRTLALRDGAGMTDGELLNAFIRRDDTALAALVRRHGPMVWGVCRRLLGHHDAEDAFQATFLVLVRKAASIRDKDAVANWLYGVAHQTAVRVRAAAAKRLSREGPVADVPEPAAREEAAKNDLLVLLDRELSRLPDKYRVLIVLCDLEGRTRKEVARQLGCPEGTVAGRLARARGMLAGRLARHGLAVSMEALAAILSSEVAAGPVPPAVVSSTIKAASLFAAGQATVSGGISPAAAALAEGVLKSMLLQKLKLAVTVLLVALACVAGTVAFLPTVTGQPPGPPVKRDEKKEEAKKAEDIFSGEWVFADGQTGGLSRIAITKADGGWVIQAWAGAADGKETDQGKTALHLLRDYEGKGDTDEEKVMTRYGFATWDHKFAKAHLTLRVENGRLVGEAYRIFTDKSDRPHYRSRYEFKKKG